MSRGQQADVIKTASGENQAYNADAQTGYKMAENDISDYGTAVGKFNASNPYVQGGEFQTAENQQLSDTAAGLGESLGQTVQGQAVRTGQNAGGAIAATENMREQNMRDLAGAEAGATERRIAADTGYKEAGLEGISTIEAKRAALASAEAGNAQSALGTQEQAAQTPGFWDQLTSDVIQGGAKVGAAYAGKG